MKYLSHSGLVLWSLVSVVFLGAVGLWWITRPAEDLLKEEKVPSISRRDKLVRPPVNHIPTNSAYQALAPRTEPPNEATPPADVAERIQLIRQQRGGELAPAERELGLEFLAGKVVVEDVAGGAFHWLADEILSSLRLQEPPQRGLAKALSGIAASPETDPVIRDYIVQHLGHLWEQHGFDQGIADALWAGVDSADETTPGSALIALRGGYDREGKADQLKQVRSRALQMAGSPTTPLAARATALSIAGEEGSQNAKALASRLLAGEDTPVILRRIAEAIIQK